MPHPPAARVDNLPADRSAAPTSRGGFVGKVLLWVIGIPILILLFALAAISRGLFNAGSASGSDDPHASKGAPSPPAIYQPHGPDQRDRAHRGVDL